MNHKSPAFQFYPADFLADENVIMMSNQEVGCYIKLLCFCWREGSIPNDLNKIARLCGEDSSAMAQLWQAVKPCFKETGDRLINPRLDKERVKQGEFRKNRQKAGKMGAAKRWSDKALDGTAKDLPMAKNASLSSSLSSTSVKNKRSKDLSSGKPDKRDFKKEALEVLEYLNRVTGKAYQKTEEIQARLKTGGTVEQCRQIIDTKLQDPYFQNNPQYYHPSTLFRKSHWDKYLNQTPEDFRNGENRDEYAEFLRSNEANG
jgi:uncharacterized phage protein (TIGR02220 family)